MKKVFLLSALFIAMIFIGCVSGRANAQDMLTRLNALESNNVAILSRMASVESKIDALTAKVDKLVNASPAAPAAPGPFSALTSVATAFAPTACDPRTGANCGANQATVAYTVDGQTYFSSMAGACSQAGSASSCGASGQSSGFGSGQWTPVRNVGRRIFGGRKGSSGCGG